VDFVHARAADPTGVFTISSGWHRPEVTGALSRIEPPAFVAVTPPPSSRPGPLSRGLFFSRRQFQWWTGLRGTPG
jgi:hypothetical protein